jgi:hypothetical protein
MKYGNWPRDQVITMSLGQNEYFGTSKMKMELLCEMKQDWWHKVILKLKG